jgi:dihydroorotase
VHHLWFDADDYETLGTQIKCNPAVKDKRHKQALFQALLDDRLDIIATDHAPHTWQEKQQNYWQAPSGVPLIQYSLPMMLEFYHQGQISLEKIAEKMSHAPAVCFRWTERIRPRRLLGRPGIGRYKPSHTVTKDSIFINADGRL